MRASLTNFVRILDRSSVGSTPPDYPALRLTRSLPLPPSEFVPVTGERGFPSSGDLGPRRLRPHRCCECQPARDCGERGLGPSSKRTRGVGCGSARGARPMEPHRSPKELRALYLSKAKDADINASMALSPAGREMWESVAKSWRELADEVVLNRPN